MFLKDRFYILILLCTCLFFGSCIKHYFTSESNVTLYVPQLKSGEIKSMHIMFHGDKGEYLHSGYVTVDEDALNLGFINVSIPSNNPAGSRIVATCITDSEQLLISKESDFFASKVSSLCDLEDADRFYPSEDYRFYRHVMDLYPLSENRHVDTLEITESYLHKGKIGLRFASLPSEVNNVRVRFYNLGTSLNLYGEYDCEESHYKKINYSFSENSPPYITSALFLPSKGEKVASNNSTRTDDTTVDYVDMVVEFFDSSGRSIYSYRLSEAGYNTPVVKDAEDNILDHRKLILKSQGSLNFHFEAFDLTFITVGIEGWGDIIEGDTPSPF